jgi:NADPH:quinone reductase-like Zn-dependent oxidoreductase
MRNIAICGEDVHSRISPPSFVTKITIDGVPVNCGLIHTQDTHFEPDRPENAHHILVKVKAFSCNYRDKSIILSTATQAPIHRFNTVGSEFVGEVLAIGSKVSGFQIGDRVVGNNAYPSSGVDGIPGGVPSNHSSKEYRVFHQAKLVKIPPEMPDEVAAAFSLGAQTSYSMVRKLEIKPGANVLVTAAKSNTSIFAIQALKQYDINLYATSTSQQFESKLLGMGVKRLIQIQPNSSDWIDRDLLREIRAETGGFDYIFDPFFDLHIGKLIPALKDGGKYVTCGLYDQYSDLINQPFEYKGLRLSQLLTTVMLNNLQIIGNCLGQTEDLERAIADYVAGKFDIAVDSVYSGDQVAEFFDRTYNSRDRFGKVVYKYESDLPDSEA